MRRVLLVLVLMSLSGSLAVPAIAGEGAVVDRANDCDFPGVPPFAPDALYVADDLRIQKVKTPVDSGKFHCHGMINDLSEAPGKAVELEGVCFLPAFFGPRPGEGKGVVTPDGHINLNCVFK